MLFSRGLNQDVCQKPIILMNQSRLRIVFASLIRGLAVLGIASLSHLIDLRGSMIVKVNFLSLILVYVGTMISHIVEHG